MLCIIRINLLSVTMCFSFAVRKNCAQSCSSAHQEDGYYSCTVCKPGLFFNVCFHLLTRIILGHYLVQDICTIGYGSSYLCQDDGSVPAGVCVGYIWSHKYSSALIVLTQHLATTAHIDVLLATAIQHLVLTLIPYALRYARRNSQLWGTGIVRFDTYYSTPSYRNSHAIPSDTHPRHI